MTEGFNAKILLVTAELYKNGNKRNVNHVVVVATDDKLVYETVVKAISKQYDEFTSVKKLTYSEIVSTKTFYSPLSIFELRNGYVIL